MSHQHATLGDTLYFWFAANDTSGSGGDGATPKADVRLAGAPVSAAPVLSPTPVLLSDSGYPDGAHEVAVAATAGNGFAADKTYAIFCTLAIDSQDPTGFVGSFSLAAAPEPRPMPYRRSTGGLVEVAVKRAEAADANLGTSSTTRSFIACGHRARIRKNGVIEAVNIYLNQITSLDSLTFRAWRYDGNWDEVGSSEAITSGFVADAWNVHDLAQPITGVQAGDFLGVEVTTSGGTSNISALDGLDIEDFTTIWDEGSKTGQNQTFASEITGRAAYMIPQMQAPTCVFLGDSFFGHVDNTPGYLTALADGTSWENVVTGRSVGDYCYALEPQLFDMVNHSQGGTQVARDLAASGNDWIQDDCIDYAPRFAVISSGYNDKVTGGKTLAQVQAAWIEVFQDLLSEDIMPVVMGLPHIDTAQVWMNGWNKWLKDYCQRCRIPFIDVYDSQTDYTSPDDRASVFGTGLHQDPTGCKAMARLIVNECLRWGW
jgi:hypothetical protein